jgi:hypothetical protein
MFSMLLIFNATVITLNVTPREGYQIVVISLQGMLLGEMILVSLTFKSVNPQKFSFDSFKRTFRMIEYIKLLNTALFSVSKKHLVCSSPENLQTERCGGYDGIHVLYNR